MVPPGPKGGPGDCTMRIAGILVRLAFDAAELAALGIIVAAVAVAAVAWGEM